MIRAAASLLVRCLVELALVLAVIAGLLGFLAWRTGRRFLWTGPSAPDGLERASLGLTSLLGAAAGLGRRSRT